MAAGGVDVSRSSVAAAKKDYDFYRNGGRNTRDVYCRDAERRQGKRPSEHDLRRKDDRHRPRGERREEAVERPPEKKRKFSPVVWDVDSKVTKAPPREKSKSPFVTRTIPNVEVTVTKKASPKDEVDALMSPEPVRLMPPVEPLEARLSGKRQVDDLEEGQFEEEEEMVKEPIVKACRWGTGLTSPKEELASRADAVPKSGRWNISSPKDSKEELISHDDTVPKSGRWNRSSLSPECGELVESEDQPGNSSGLGSGDRRLEQVSADEHSDREYYSSDHNELEDEVPTPSSQGGSNMLLGSRCVNEFQKLNKINEGTYGIVYKARDAKTNEIVALKKIKMKEDKYEEEYGFPLTSLREINILLSCKHPSIVNVKEVVVGGKNDSDVYMVMEHLEHDLKGVMDKKKQPFSTSEVKCLMLQLLEGLKYLHTNWVIHRDLKPSNLLMNNTGELKICDFGMARQYGSPIKAYTQMVITQWYRPPELLLGAKEYSTAVDMWSVGCIMAELLTQKPLFPGKTELDQLQKIFAVLGTPREEVWPGFSSLPNAKLKFPNQPYNLLRKKFPAISFVGGQILSERGFDLLNSLLSLDPENRLTVEEAVNHGWFHEVPLPKSKDFMPTFPPKH